MKCFVFSRVRHSCVPPGRSPPSQFSSVLSSPSLSLPPVFLHFSHLDSILGFFVYCFCFPKSRPPCLFRLYPPTLSNSPLSAAPTIYHSLPPSHLSLGLPLLCFSSGSPLIKPLCLLPPGPVSTHTSHTSFSPFFVCLLSVLCPSASLSQSPSKISLCLPCCILDLDQTCIVALLLCNLQMIRNQYFWPGLG